MKVEVALKVAFLILLCASIPVLGACARSLGDDRVVILCAACMTNGFLLAGLICHERWKRSCDDT